MAVLGATPSVSAVGGDAARVEQRRDHHGAVQRDQQARTGGARLRPDVLFVALRAGNAYGDARPWSAQDSPLFTLFSFVDTTKYPPSLLYLAMTLGPALIALALFERWRGRSADFVRVFGRVAMFYYPLHLFLLSGVAAVAWRAAFGESFFAWAPPDAGGWSLPVVYAIWIGVVVVLYFPCRWFAALKARRRDAWLSYL